MLEGIIGRHLVERTFWFFATSSSSSSRRTGSASIPGVGTIGWGHTTDHGFVIEQPLLRGANADLNMTLAMALVFFALLDRLGAAGSRARRGAQGAVRAEGRDAAGVMRVLLVVVFFAAGCLE